jgi:hypothetical protein
MSPPGGPKGESRSAQHEGTPVSRDSGPPRSRDRSERLRDVADPANAAKCADVAEASA